VRDLWWMALVREVVDVRAGCWSLSASEGRGLVILSV